MVRDLPCFDLIAMLEEDLGQPCTYGRLHRHLSFQDLVALSSLWPTERTQSDSELTALLTALQKETAFLKMTDATAPKCSALKNIRWVAAQGGTPAAYAVRDRRGWTFHTSFLGPLVGWRPSGVWRLQISEEFRNYYLTLEPTAAHGEVAGSAPWPVLRPPWND